MDERWQKSLPVSWKNVRFTGGFWKKRQEINEQVTLPAEYEQCKSSGRVDSVKCIYKPRENSGPGQGVFTIDGVLEENLAHGETVPIITGIPIWQNGLRGHPMPSGIKEIRKQRQ